MSIKNAIPFLLILCATMAFTSCKSNIMSESEQDNSLLVQVYSDSILPILEQEYSSYDLKKEKTVSRPMKIYLYTFNTAKVADTTLLKILKKSAFVKEAQINHKVATRNK